MTSRQERTDGCRASRRRPEAGYSLAELLVVLVIIGLVAAVFVPNMGAFFRAYRIHGAADQLSGHLRTARQIAVTQHLPVTFTINPSPTNNYSFTYTIPGKPTTTQTFNLVKEVAITTAPTAGVTYTINQNGTVSNPTTPDDINPTSNFARLTSDIGSGYTDRYTITLTVAGKVGVKFVR